MQWPQETIDYIEQLPSSVKFVAGIDEVGRGALAGPMTLGLCVVGRKNLDQLEVIDNLGDSKVTSHKKRAQILQTIDSNITLETFPISANVIDERGIRGSYYRALRQIVATQDPVKTFYLFDYGISLPSDTFQYHKTYKKGDSLIPTIALASIYAKEARDNYMKIIVHKRFPEYGFNTHVGYGTKKHRHAIISSGLTNFHRQSFCQKYI